MQKYMTMALFSGLALGVIISNDLHWINAVLAGSLYVVASTLAKIHAKEPK